MIQKLMLIKSYLENGIRYLFILLFPDYNLDGY